MYDDIFGSIMNEPEAAGAMSFVAIFLIVYLVILGVALIWSVAAYVLQSLGVHTIAKRRGINRPWLAWIPVGNLWTLGCISDQYQYVAQGKVKNKRKILLGLYIGYLAVYAVYMVAYVLTMVGPMVAEISGSSDAMASVGLSMGGMLLMMLVAVAMMGVAITMAVFQYMALYDLYRSCDPDHSVLFLVLDIVVGVTMPFFIFFSRNKDLGMPPRREETECLE